MNTRKAAVVGCKEGPWVSTYQLKGLGLEVNGPEDVVVETHLRSEGGKFSMVTSGPGTHRLVDAMWARSVVRKGERVLCFLVSGVTNEN